MRLDRFCSFCGLLLRFPPAISPNYAVFIFFELNIATAFPPAKITYSSSQTDRAPFFTFVFFSSSVRVCNHGIEVIFPFNLRVLDYPKCGNANRTPNYEAFKLWLNSHVDSFH